MWTLGLITGWPCFGRNCLKPNVSCSCSSDLHSGQEDRSSLQNCFSSALFLAHLMWMALLRSRHSISRGLRSGLWPGDSTRRVFFGWSHSVVNLLRCFGSLSCCITHPLSSFNWRKDGLNLSRKMSLTKRKRNLASSFFRPWWHSVQRQLAEAPLFTVGMRFWCAAPPPCCPSKQLNGFICMLNILLLGLGNIQVLFCKLQAIGNLFLDSSSFFRGVLPWTPYKFNGLCIVELSSEMLACARDFWKSLPLEDSSCPHGHT